MDEEGWTVEDSKALRVSCSQEFAIHSVVFLQHYVSCTCKMVVLQHVLPTLHLRLQLHLLYLVFV